METIDQLRRHYRFTSEDEENLARIGEILLPISDLLAEEFYDYLSEDPYTAAFFPTERAVEQRKRTLTTWFTDLFTVRYDHRFLSRLQKIGKVHVKIGLKADYVNAAMNFVRDFCHRHVAAAVSDEALKERLLITLHKALDINLAVMTSSYQAEELRRVFLSHRVESLLIQWAQRLLHGLNLLLLIGLLAMALGVAGLLAHDIIHALTEDLEYGVIKALGSLLVLWMMIELLHTEVVNLRGGKFHVRIFVELALVAFIRKLFVASLEHAEPVRFALLLAALLVLGVTYFLVSWTAAQGRK